jgi:hypothetical protein
MIYLSEKVEEPKFSFVIEGVFWWIFDCQIGSSIVDGSWLD